MTRRLEHIDALKGLAIILVVMGHVLSSFYADPYQIYATGPRSSMMLFRIIYSFHMPLFMFLSGYVTLRLHDWSIQTCAMTLWKRFRALVIPFFTVGFLRYCVFQRDMLDYWFLWILFQFILLTLIVEYVCSKVPTYGRILSTILLLCTAGVLQYFGASLNLYDHMPLLDMGHWSLFLFFVFGYLCAKHALISNILKNNLVYSIAIVLFAFLTFWVTIKGYHFPLWSKINCILPLFAIVSLVFLFDECLDKTHKVYQGLEYLGQKSLAIYLVHFFFVIPLYRIGDLFVDANAMFAGGGGDIRSICHIGNTKCANNNDNIDSCKNDRIKSYFIDHIIRKSI